MKVLLKISVVLCTAFILWALLSYKLATPSQKINSLVDQASDLFRRENYSGANSTLNTAIEVAEKTYGSKSIQVVNLLDVLQDVYWRQGKYSETEALWKRALEIEEENYKLYHSNVLRRLKAMVAYYKKNGREKEARIFEERLKEIESIK